MLSALLLLALAPLPWSWGCHVRPCHCTWPESPGRRGLQVPNRQTRQVQHQQRRHRHRLRGSKSHSEEFPPYIIDHPTDLVVRWDQPATLNCRVAGSPAPTINWYRNGEYVETSKDNIYSQRTLLPDGSLFFLRLNQRKGQSDEGVYTCVATNHLGTASSRNATLYIAALQEDLQLQPSDLLVTVGEQAALECVPPRGRPEPTISWRKDGVPISQKTGHYEVSSRKLLLRHAQRSDAGLYVCVASNQAGERESKAALVTVLEKPAFTRRPSDVVVKSGSAVQLGCGVQGDPEPHVWWHKEHGELPWGRYEVDKENTLHIQHVTTSDSGRYICMAQNHVGTILAKATLTVQDPLDTGQAERERSKDVLRELMDVQLYLDNSTVLPSSSSVYLHWKVLHSVQHTEDHVVLYRSLLPVSTDWVEWKATGEHSTIIPALKRGYKYEFKVRPYSGKVHGPDSNVRHLWIPEEVPSAAPEHVSITAAENGNGTVSISWDPPPHHMHNGIIRGYQVWYLGNETHRYPNRTVDAGTHSLETVVLPAGVRYCIQVAAFNGAGLGVPSNTTCHSTEPSVGMMATTPAGFSFQHVLAVLRQPVFIASVGSLLWVLLMVLAIYLYHHHARSHHQKQQHAMGKGLCRYTSEDTMVKRSPRMHASNSPWLADSWKSTSCSNNFSASSSSSSQLLWPETKDSLDMHHPSVPFDRPAHSSQIPAGPRGPDNNSLYKVLYVDLPARDMPTFPCSLLPSTPGSHPRAMGPGGPTDHRPGSCYSQSFGMENSCVRGAGRRGLWQPAGPGPPSLILQRPWENSGKRELQQAHSTPVLSSSIPAYTSSTPGTRLSGKHHAGKGDGAKVLQTFSSPKLLQSQGSLHMTGMLPPPPVPPAPHGPQAQGMQPESRDDWEAPQPFLARQLLPSTRDSHGEKLPLTLAPYCRLTTASPAPSLGDDCKSVLTPDQVAEYLELSVEAEYPQRLQESTASVPQALCPPHTYGYICGPLPSELGVGPAHEEEDDLDAEGGGCQDVPFLRRYCRTPSSSLSEAEGSVGGSLLNGWGSVSEENFTSTRCSLVSSSDGSFLVDANFATALAVAVDSFCFGLSQGEAELGYPDFSPPASPLDGLLPPPEHWRSTALAGTEPLPLPEWAWSPGWLEKMEATYSQRAEGLPAAEKPDEGKTALHETRSLLVARHRPNGACVLAASGPAEGDVGECQDPCPTAHGPMPNSIAVPKKRETPLAVMEQMAVGMPGGQV